jgi:SAM-dependent methyltransferase
MTGRASIDGYLLGEPYPSNFHREFSPAWIDAVLRCRGLVPPRAPRAVFRLLDLGCGDGFGLIVLAAAYPEAEFVGVDALEAHIQSAADTAARLGLANIRFRCERFADIAPEASAFDYVTGQGVIAWISPDNRRHVFRIAGEALKPGGIACFGYNAMPGWKDVIPLQRLIRELAGGEGPAWQRFRSALAQCRSIAEAGAASLHPEWPEWLEKQVETLPQAYFPHEYLNDNWSPLWSADVRDGMAAYGCAYFGNARRDRLREDFCLTTAQRARIAALAEAPRETAADLFVNASFRIDMFGRDVPPAPEPLDARLDSWWAATADEAEADYTLQTPAGTLRFDNAAAHAILHGLARGPNTLRSIHATGAAGTAADVLNASDALFAGGHIIPAEPAAGTPRAAPVNAEIAARIGAGAHLGVQVGPHGALALPSATVTAAHDGDDQARAVLARLGIL